MSFLAFVVVVCPSLCYFLKNERLDKNKYKQSDFYCIIDIFIIPCKRIKVKKKKRFFNIL